RLLMILGAELLAYGLVHEVAPLDEKFGERGEWSLLLSSVPESWQPARALGGGHPAERVSSGDRPLPSPGLRHPLDSGLVSAFGRVIPTEKAGSHHQTRGKREEATGTDVVSAMNHRFS